MARFATSLKRGKKAELRAKEGHGDYCCSLLGFESTAKCDDGA
jgi:hypothetical protein